MSTAPEPIREGPALSVSSKLRVGPWLIRHLQSLVYTLGQLFRVPGATAMTASVIGIALALPAGLYVLLENAQQLSRGWDGSAQISLFMHPSVTEADGEKAARRLRGRVEVASVDVISRTEALEEYRRLSGFSDVLKALGNENPLPVVLVLTPAPGHADPDTVRSLVDELGGRKDVDLAQYDLEWVKRLYAIMETLQRGVLLLAGLLALGVLLIVGNTIRLGIQNRREEIEIAKLFGATDAFIRRPFLYSGFWYGLLGGIIAWLLVVGAFSLLREPVMAVAALYHSDFVLVTLDFLSVVAVLSVGALLGLGGSWLAVGRHLGDIEPG